MYNKLQVRPTTAGTRVQSANREADRQPCSRQGAVEGPCSRLRSSRPLMILTGDMLNHISMQQRYNKTTMDKQGKQINDLQANLQNKRKVIDKQAQQVEKQAQQIEDLNAELQRQREIAKNLEDALATQQTAQEALQAQVLILANQAQSSTIPTKPVQNKAKSDDSRIHRLYSEIVAGAQDSVDSAISHDVQAEPTTQDTQTSAPTSTETDGNTSAPTPTQKDMNATAQVRIFADSLWNDVDPKKMYKHKSVNIIKTTTLPKAADKIETTQDTGTELVIIHVGSNDLDNTKARPDSKDICVEQTFKVIDSAKRSFPNARITMSQVLPRGMNMNSHLNRNIASYNDVIERACVQDEKLTYVRHRLLSEDRSMYKADAIHIKPDTGVRLMVADVKRTLRHQQLATTRNQDRNPIPQHRNSSGKLPTSTSAQQTQPERRHPPSLRWNPSRKPEQRPLPTWNQAPPPPPQWIRQSGPPGTRAHQQDKRQTVETLINMLTDFLRH
ncbi:hypothetical protein Bbelb_319200 [Branchiostoma belcheri]|nr:hypothetical protein Bbelb_319200 [Branchiostoma belcheri]